jgi:hypothetical protein
VRGAVWISGAGELAINPEWICAKADGGVHLELSLRKGLSFESAVGRLPLRHEMGGEGWGEVVLSFQPHFHVLSIF